MPGASARSPSCGAAPVCGSGTSSLPTAGRRPRSPPSSRSGRSTGWPSPSSSRCSSAPSWPRGPARSPTSGTCSPASWPELGFTVRTTAANWVLVDRPGLRGALVPHRVVVRDCASFGLPGVHRVALPRPDGSTRCWRPSPPSRRLGLTAGTVTGVAAAAGVAVDQLLGEPPARWHPVALFGTLVQRPRGGSTPTGAAEAPSSCSSVSAWERPWAAPAQGGRPCARDRRRDGDLRRGEDAGRGGAADRRAGRARRPRRRPRRGALARRTPRRRARRSGAQPRHRRVHRREQRRCRRRVAVLGDRRGRARRAGPPGGQHARRHGRPPRRPLRALRVGQRPAGRPRELRAGPAHRTGRRLCPARCRGDGLARRATRRPPRTRHRTAGWWRRRSPPRSASGWEARTATATSSRIGAPSVTAGLRGRATSRRPCGSAATPRSRSPLAAIGLQLVVHASRRRSR